MQKYIFFLIIALSTLLTSCRKDFDLKPSTGQLVFSKSTVYLDTVFTNTSSSTYMLKVYNNSNDDIVIPNVSLGKGFNSKYRIMVDGTSGEDGPDSDNLGDGKVFRNVELLAKDSLHVFIEVTADVADANPADFLYTDKILFDSGTNEQKVDLVTLIQDAVFLYPEKNEVFYFHDGDLETKGYGFDLNENDPIHGNEFHFTNQKPYVIYGYAGVPANKTLIIDAGARVHFHDGAGIFVKEFGSIQVNGSTSVTDALENEVIFEGDRLEPSYSETAGQWGAIILDNGSTNNSFNHLTIKNSTAGLFVLGQDATTVQIINTQIYNASIAGILTRNAKVYGENIVISNCGQSSLACTLGGSYEFNHCTFTNFWNQSNRQTPAVLLDNTYDDGQTVFVSDLNQAKFRNCIIFGSGNMEIGLSKANTSNLFNYDIQYSLIRFNDVNGQFNNNPLYDGIKLAANQNIISNNSANNDPKFKNTAKNNLRILNTSSCIGKGTTAVTITHDADGTPRTSPPDLGAYEHLP